MATLRTTLERLGAERRDGHPPNVKRFQRWVALHKRARPPEARHAGFPSSDLFANSELNVTPQKVKT